LDFARYETASRLPCPPFVDFISFWSSACRGEKLDLASENPPLPVEQTLKDPIGVEEGEIVIFERKEGF
jgi:hypothetical protein